MKNYLVIYCAVIAVLGVEVCTAQSLTIRAGVNAANQHESNSELINNALANMGVEIERNKLPPRIGGNFGVLVDFPGVGGLSFETGLLFNSKGRDAEVIDTAVYFRVTQQEVFVDVPLLLKYTTNGDNVRFFVGAGGYVGMGIWGWRRHDMRILDPRLRYHMNDVYFIEDIEWSSRFGQPYKANRFEYGGIVSVGVEIGSLVVNGSYMYAWSGMYGYGGTDPRYVYSLSLGYKFDIMNFFGIGGQRQ